MFDYLRAKNCIQRLGRQRDRGNFTDVVYWFNVPYQLPMVLTKILSLIAAMREVRSILTGPGAGVQHPAPLGQLRGLIFNPSVAHKGLIGPQVIAPCSRKSVHTRK